MTKEKEKTIFEAYKISGTMSTAHVLVQKKCLYTSLSDFFVVYCSEFNFYSLL